MIVGEFQDGLPRVTLTLPGQRGAVEVEFVVDTAFNGGITLPPDILQQLGFSPTVRVRNRLASGGEEYASAAMVRVDWHDGSEVLKPSFTATIPF